MYRMGQGNPNWTRMGMPCSVMNAGGKVDTREEVTGKKRKDTRKDTGAGLDYIKSMLDLCRKMY
jgi:hypothetical protein